MTPNITDKTAKNVNWLKERPIAHRGLHNAKSGIYENTLSAAKAAMDAGYSIEVDLQPASDGTAMVFHDYKLERMTNQSGEIRDHDSRTLSSIGIMSTQDTIPTLQELLDLIQGRVSIVLELKGLSGKDDGFVVSVAHDLKDYQGDVAIMSFHHHLLEDARKFAPHLSLGLTAEGGEESYSQHMLAIEKTHPDFISYELENLNTRFVREFTQSGKPAISWTVRSPQDAEFSNQYVDQITFEGFTP